MTKSPSLRKSRARRKNPSPSVDQQYQAQGIQRHSAYIGREQACRRAQQRDAYAGEKLGRRHNKNAEGKGSRTGISGGFPNAEHDTRSVCPQFRGYPCERQRVVRPDQKYVSLIAPEKDDIVKLYDKDIPIFDHYNITRQIKSSFGKTVSFRSGAYLIIESTEALHVIDVNSGNRSKACPDQESNALDVNLKAADEIARQLRLRDMGGIIVVDYIDMAKQEHRQALYDHMREVMSNDRARHNILPLSKFGLMQITRQRVRPALDIVTQESCPSCYGKGHVQASLLFTDKLEEKIQYLTDSLKIKKFTMYIHPYVEAYIKKGIFSLYSKWRRKYGRGVKVVADESLAFLQYRVFDQDKNEIDLKEESDMNSSQTKNNQKVETRNGVDAEDEKAKPRPKPQKEKQKPKEQPKSKEAQPQHKEKEPTQPQPKDGAKQKDKEQPRQKGDSQQKPKEQPKKKEQAQPKTETRPETKPETKEIRRNLPMIVETDNVPSTPDNSDKPVQKKRPPRRKPQQQVDNEETDTKSES